MCPPIDVSDLAASPLWYPLRLASPAAVAMLALSEDEYRAASFLDDRLLTAQRRADLVPLTSVRSAAAALDVRVNFIFHIGHVGSTLLARLVGAHPDGFALREPSMLRALADRRTAQVTSAAADALVLGPRDTLAMLGRRWRSGQTVVVKATSIVNEIATEVMDLAPGGTALLMYSRPRQYLQCILGGPNSRLESMHLAGARFARLRRRFETTASAPPGLLVPPRSEGEVVAMNWLAEMSALEETSRRHPGRIRWLDFDRFLLDPHRGLEFALAAFDMQASPAQIAAWVSGPLMQRYSKDPRHAYDAALRRDVLRTAAAEHAAEIERGIEWLSVTLSTAPGWATLRELLSTPLG